MLRNTIREVTTTWRVWTCWPEADATWASVCSWTAVTPPCCWEQEQGELETWKCTALTAHNTLLGWEGVGIHTHCSRSKRNGNFSKPKDGVPWNRTWHCQASISQLTGNILQDLKLSSRVLVCSLPRFVTVKGSRFWSLWFVTTKPFLQHSLSSSLPPLCRCLPTTSGPEGQSGEAAGAVRAKSLFYF